MTFIFQICSQRRLLQLNFEVFEGGRHSRVWVLSFSLFFSGQNCPLSNQRNLTQINDSIFFWLFADWNFVRYSWIHNKSFCKDLRLIYLRCTLTHFLWKNYDIESASNWKNMSVHVLSHSNPHESDVSQNKIFFTSWH